MGLEDITKQAQEFLGDDKVKKAMQSEQAEGHQRQAARRGGRCREQRHRGKFEQRIGGARNAADKQFGNK